VDLREIVWDGTDWIDGIEGKKDTCEHGNEPPCSIHFGKFLSRMETGGFSRKAQLRGFRHS
jgi:hypothetical protein